MIATIACALPLWFACYNFPLPTEAGLCLAPSRMGSPVLVMDRYGPGPDHGSDPHDEQHPNHKNYPKGPHDEQHNYPDDNQSNDKDKPR